MATNYIRANGNPLFLQRILGHSGITQTIKYVALVTEDLQAAHEQRSLLEEVGLHPETAHDTAGKEVKKHRGALQSSLAATKRRSLRARACTYPNFGP